MKTEIIKFHEDELLAYKEGDQVWVAVRPIINALGVHGDWALRAIKNDEILGRVHAIREVHDASGRRQNMVVLPIHHVHGWLFNIQTNKVKESVRPKLILYKMECYQALYDHFYGVSKQVRDNMGDRFQHHLRKTRLERLDARIRHEIKKEAAAIEAIDLNTYHQLELFTDKSLLK